MKKWIISKKNWDFFQKFRIIFHILSNRHSKGFYCLFLLHVDQLRKLVTYSTYIIDNKLFTKGLPTCGGSLTCMNSLSTVLKTKSNTLFNQWVLSLYSSIYNTHFHMKTFPTIQALANLKLIHQTGWKKPHYLPLEKIDLNA